MTHKTNDEAVALRRILNIERKAHDETKALLAEALARIDELDDGVQELTSSLDDEGIEL